MRSLFIDALLHLDKTAPEIHKKHHSLSPLTLLFVPVQNITAITNHALMKVMDSNFCEEIDWDIFNALGFGLPLLINGAREIKLIK